MDSEQRRIKSLSVQCQNFPIDRARISVNGRLLPVRRLKGHDALWYPDKPRSLVMQYDDPWSLLWHRAEAERFARWCYDEITARSTPEQPISAGWRSHELTMLFAARALSAVHRNIAWGTHVRRLASFAIGSTTVEEDLRRQSRVLLAIMLGGEVLIGHSPD